MSYKVLRPVARFEAVIQEDEPASTTTKSIAARSPFLSEFQLHTELNDPRRNLLRGHNVKNRSSATGDVPSLPTDDERLQGHAIQRWKTGVQQRYILRN